MSWMDYKPDPAASREDSSGDFLLVGGIGAVVALLLFGVFCFAVLLLR